MTMPGLDRIGGFETPEDILEPGEAGQAGGKREQPIRGGRQVAEINA